MKSIIAILIFATTVSYSQQRQGVAYYVEHKDLSFVLDGMDEALDSVKETNTEISQMEGQLKEMLKGMLKKEEKVKTQLSFKENISFYRKRDADIKEEDINNNGMMISSIIPDPDKVYLDMDKNTKITSRDFMSKKFLIKDSPNTYSWKITGEQKLIANMPCLEAVHEDSVSKIIAWFAPQIPVSAGPKGLNGLKGLIVAAKIQSKSKEEEGKMSNVTVMLDYLKFEEPAKTELKEPKKGKIIKGEEAYDKIIEDKMKEMKESSGNSKNGITISIGN
jgi:GLPGLI family protein